MSLYKTRVFLCILYTYKQTHVFYISLYAGAYIPLNYCEKTDFGNSLSVTDRSGQANFGENKTRRYIPPTQH
jgi:hypothetical protein